MSVLTIRNVLPVVTSVLATLFLATAVPHQLVAEAVYTGPVVQAGQASR